MEIVYKNNPTYGFWDQLIVTRSILDICIFFENLGIQNHG